MDTEARRICDEVLKPLVERFEAVSQAEWDSKCHDPTWLKDGKPADMYGSIEDWYETLDLGLASAWIEFNLGVDRDKRFREVLRGVLEAARIVDRAPGVELLGRPHRHCVDEQDFQKARSEMIGTVDHLQRLIELIESGDHNGQLTEPLTRIQIGNLFVVHRNQVDKVVLSKYHHEVEPDGRIRMLVSDMPPAYRADLPK